MKKIIISFVCSLILVACGNKDNNVTAVAAPSTTNSGSDSQANSDVIKINSSDVNNAANASANVRNDPVKTTYINGADIIAKKLKARNVSTPQNITPEMIKRNLKMFYNSSHNN
jgi:hypothetical protein